MIIFLTKYITAIFFIFLIIEPENGIPTTLIEDSLAYENNFSQVVETKNYNGILVQKRLHIKPLEKINFVKSLCS